MTAPEVVPLRHGLAAVIITRDMPAAEVRAIRERLGLVCRHGRNARKATGTCPACATERRKSA